MKKIILLIIVMVIVFGIYILFRNDKKTLLFLGDSYSLGYNKYSKEDYGYNDYLKEYFINELKDSIENFRESDYRITDLINDIKYNKSIDGRTIQNALIKSDILTISIGSEEYNKKNLFYSEDAIYEYINEMIIDLEELFKLIRLYCKEEIYYVSFFSSNDKLLEYLNRQVDDLCKKYNITYVCGNCILDRNFDIYPDKEEYKIIADAIIDTL